MVIQNSKYVVTYSSSLEMPFREGTDDFNNYAEMIDKVDNIKEFTQNNILEVVNSIEGELEYEPPIFSAKRINGQRAYDLARAGKEVVLNRINSTVYKSKLIHYMHPFVTFEVVVSEGSYVRSPS